MLNLSELKFNVNTDALVDAKNAIDALAAAQANLNKTTRAGTAAGGENSKPAKQTKTQIDLLSKLQELYGDLANGATRWEASQLRAARSMGLPLQEVEEQLKNIRKLTKDPFDSAIGSVRSVTQHFEELQNRIKLTNDGLILTTKQMREYSRIAFEVEGKLKAQGVDTKSNDGSAQLLSQIAKEEQAYISKAIAVNKLADAERERINTSKAALQAEKFLATEMQRVDSILNELNREHSEGTILSERHANSISRFANQLKAAGITGSAATAQLEQYRTKMQQIETIENKRAQNRLANALAPQISDVAVSLAGGMPLHLVIMQQGLQIRDLIGQSGVAADQLQQTMRDAMKNMVTSIAGTVAALGTMTYGALADAGKAVVGFSTKVFGMNTVLQSAQASLVASAATGNGLATALLGVGRAATVAATALAATGVGALVIGLTAAAVAFVQLIGANNDLARELAVTGNMFGVTTDSSLQYVEGLTRVGATTREAIGILGAMSKAGNLSREQIDLIGKAAVDMERAAGVAIGDTVKRFSDFAKDPVKALSTLQVQTGAVQPEIIKLVDELTKQGNAARASGVAVEELARIMGVQSAKMQEDLHPLTQAWVGFKNLISEVWTGIGNVINRATGTVPRAQKIAEQIKAIQDIRSGKAGLIGLVAPANYKEDELRDLQKQLLMIDKAAQAEADRARQRAEDEKARAKANELEIKYLGKEEKKKRALAQLDKDRDLLAAQGKPMSSQAYNEAKQKIEDDFKPKANSAAAKEVNYYAASIEKLNDAFVKVEVNANNYNDIQKGLLDIFNDPGFLTMPEKQKLALVEHANSLLAASQATDDLAAAEKRRAKDQETYQKILSDSNKAYEDSLKVYRDSAKSVEERLAAMQEENKAVALSEQMNISLAEAIELTSIARLREQQIAAMGDESKVLAIQREIDARKQIVEEIRKRGNKKNADDAAKAYSESVQREFEAMRDGIADSITTALFEGGKAGSQKLRTLIVNELKKPVVLMVQAVVNTLLGSIMGGGQGSSVDNMLGGGGGGGAIGSIAQIGGIGAAFGTGMAASFSSMMASGVSGWATAAGSLIGTGAASGIAAGLGMLAGPLAAVGLVASLLGKKTPGEQAMGGFASSRGLEATQANAESLTGDAGMARDLIKRRNEGMELVARNTVDSVLAATEQRAKALGLNIAIGIDAGFAANLNGKGANKNAFGYAAIFANGQQVGTINNRELGSDVPKAIEAFTAQVYEAAAAAVLAGTDFGKAGETAGQTLTRLASSLDTVNKTFDVLGHTMYSASLAGADMSSQLVDLFGGIEQFSAATSAYYEAFYSEQEKLDNKTKQLTTAFANLGLELPNTIAGYRALVQNQDMTTDSGRRLYTALIQLSPLFAEVANAVTNVSQTISKELLRMASDKAIANGLKTYEQWKDGLTSALGVLEDAVAKEIKSLEDTTDAAIKVLESNTDAAIRALESNADAAIKALEANANAERSRLAEIEADTNALIDNLQRVFDLLKQNTDELYANTDATAQFQALQGRQFIQQALMQARSGGTLPGADDLQRAIGFSRQGLDSSLYASKVDQDRQTLLLANELSELQKYAGDQLTDAQKQLQVLQEQLKLVDSLLEIQRNQLQNDLDTRRKELTDMLNLQRNQLQNDLDTRRNELNDMLNLQREQVDAALGNVKATMSLTDAMLNLAGILANKQPLEDAIAPIIAAMKAGTITSDAAANSLAALGINLTPGGLTDVQGNGVYQSTGGAVAIKNASDATQSIVNDLTGQSYLTRDVIAYVNDRLAANDPLSVYREAVNRGISSSDLDDIMGWPSGTSKNWAVGNGLPSFAVGTNYVKHDMLAQIHEGEAIIPAKHNPYNPQNETQTAALVSALIEEVQMLRAETRAVVNNTAKTSRILDDVTQDGDTLKVEVV